MHPHTYCVSAVNVNGYGPLAVLRPPPNKATHTARRRRKRAPAQPLPANLFDCVFHINIFRGVQGLENKTKA
jgi:hypothetical protein